MRRCYRVIMFFLVFFFIEIEHEHICQGHRLAVRATLSTINGQLIVYFESICREKLNAVLAVRLRGLYAGGNTLRTYTRLKENYGTGQYVKLIAQKRYMISLDSG